MYQRIINQLAKEALIELGKQHYAEITIEHFGQAFVRLKKYAAKIGEVFLSDCLIRKYLLDVYGWDIDPKTIPTAHVTSQLRAIRILQFYEENDSIPGRISNAKEQPDCFRYHYDMYNSDRATPRRCGMHQSVVKWNHE